jgi:tight adherence protein C
LRLVDRIAPYLADGPAPSRLLTSAPSWDHIGVSGLIAPALAEVIRLLDRVVGGSRSVRRRLGGLGSSASVEDFRIEQVIWAIIGLIAAGTLVALGTATRATFDPAFTIVAAAVGAIAGVLARDWWLTQQLRTRERVMLAEFPVVADLLALAVLAGEAPIDAIDRVCSRARGELTKDLDAALIQARAGTPIIRALSDLAGRSTLDALSRFVEGLVVAIERGTPLAEVLRAQAADVREQSKRSLLEAGGRKEVQMMVPVVFLILPVTVLFALYPGLLSVVSLSN